MSSRHTPIPFELDALAKARNYQQWIHDLAAPFLGRRILEIGAGIGNLSRWLPVFDLLVLTEADPTLLDLLRRNLEPERAANPRVRTERFDVISDPVGRYDADMLDTVVSFNVLEHIEDDRLALRRLCDLLRRSQAPGPRRMICFVPAHTWAYGRMDRSFGHFRRYSRRSLLQAVREVAPEATARTFHFNVFGLLGWWLQGRVLKRVAFGAASVRMFEANCRWIRAVDSLLHGVIRLPLGQSLGLVLEWPARDHDDVIAPAPVSMDTTTH